MLAHKAFCISAALLFALQCINSAGVDSVLAYSDPRLYSQQRQYTERPESRDSLDQQNAYTDSAQEDDASQYQSQYDEADADSSLYESDPRSDAQIEFDDSTIDDSTQRMPQQQQQPSEVSEIESSLPAQDDSSQLNFGDKSSVTSSTTKQQQSQLSDSQLLPGADPTHQAADHELHCVAPRQCYKCLWIIHAVTGERVCERLSVVMPMTDEDRLQHQITPKEQLADDEAVLRELQASEGFTNEQMSEAIQNAEIDSKSNPLAATTVDDSNLAQINGIDTDTNPDEYTTIQEAQLEKEWQLQQQRVQLQLWASQIRTQELQLKKLQEASKYQWNENTQGAFKAPASDARRASEAAIAMASTLVVAAIIVALNN